MERALKERLVGAAVLVAVAVLLVGEMFSGPSKLTKSDASIPVPEAAEPAQLAEPTETVNAEPAQAIQAASSSAGSSASAEADLKSFTIDLRKSDPQTQVAVEQTTEVVPPPISPPSHANTPAQSPPEPVVTARPKPPHEEPRAVQSSTETAPDKAPTSSAVPAAGWAVQLASLGTRAAANQMADELKKAGFTAFVMPFESKGKQLYRVRLGPFHDRASADSVQAKAKRTHAAAAVVPHP